MFTGTISARIVKRIVASLDAIAPSRASEPQPAEHLRTGTRGEEAAYFHLRQLGYVMVARNWRSPLRRGELDLIGYDGAMLCFIEVKTRTTLAVRPAEAAVDFEKQRDLRAVAREYLRRTDAGPACRFDVVSVFLEAGAEPAITVFRNAFTME